MDEGTRVFAGIIDFLLVIGSFRCSKGEVWYKRILVFVILAPVSCTVVDFIIAGVTSSDSPLADFFGFIFLRGVLVTCALGFALSDYGDN